MKNQIQSTINQGTTQSHPDPVLQVEEWKDKVDEETKDMTSEELTQYYLEALQWLKHNPAV